MQGVRFFLALRFVLVRRRRRGGWMMRGGRAEGDDDGAQPGKGSGHVYYGFYWLVD